MEMFNEGGLRDEGGAVDPKSGNDVPIGSMKKEVRDDIPAMLSEGEFVLPADVVRYVGLENLMKLRQDAKMGLKQMEAMGQMGNSEEATMPDDLPFGPADIVILGKPQEDEPKEMNQGGFATGIGGYQPSVFQNQPQTTAPVIPPSSIAPPPPAASPAGGYMPKFMGNLTAATDNSLVSNNQTTGTTNTGTATSTSTTDTKFVPTVEDAYKSIKYINKETGEIRDFFFYQGSPVTPIPEGFVPYNETADEVVDDLESTQVETTSVRTGGGGSGSINIPQPEKIDWSTYSAEELQDAFDKNRKTRMALTAMGAINPLIALFGQGATRMQEKEILAAMKEKGIEPPEVEGGLFSKIGSFIGGIFGQEKEEQAAKIASNAALPEITTSVIDQTESAFLPASSLRSPSFPRKIEESMEKVFSPSVSNEDPFLPTSLEKRDNIKDLRRRIEGDRSRSRFEKDTQIAAMKAMQEEYGDVLGNMSETFRTMSAEKERLLRARSPSLGGGMTIGADDLDPRGADQRGQTSAQKEDSIEAARKKATEDARKASKKRRDKRKKLMSDARKGKGAFAKRKQKTGVGGRNIGGR